MLPYAWKVRRALPLLRDLAPFTLLARCEYCGEMSFATDLCESSGEARRCLPAETANA